MDLNTASDYLQIPSACCGGICPEQGRRSWAGQKVEACLPALSADAQNHTAVYYSNGTLCLCMFRFITM